MSTTSDLSSGPPLCYCGVPVRVRNSLTETNPARKWYGCINYKVNLEISFVLYAFVSSLTYLPFFFMQRAGDCDFFKWADKEMFAYEKGLMEYLQQMEERRHDDNNKVEKMIERKCNEHYAKLRRELGLGQNNGRMYVINNHFALSLLLL